MVYLNKINLNLNHAWVLCHTIITHLERDWIPNELRVFLDDLLDPLLLKVLILVLLHVEDDVSATPNRLHVLVTADGERTTSGRLPQVLLIIIVLCSKIQADA